MMTRRERWRHRHDAIVLFDPPMAVLPDRVIRAPGRGDPQVYPDTVMLVLTHAPPSASAFVYDVLADWLSDLDCRLRRVALNDRFVAYRPSRVLRRRWPIPRRIGWSPDWRNDGGLLVLKAFALIPEA